MNLRKLFEMQAKLDARIEREHPRRDGEDRLAKKILALQVELGELANEWRGFKFWSHDQEPRTWYPNEKDICESCKGKPIFIENGKIVGQCEDCDGCGVHFHNPLLEEYVDCLHFILSIGLELELTDFHINYSTVKNMQMNGSLLKKFSSVFAYVYKVECHKNQFWYDALLESFICLGFSLGFTSEQIEQAYIEKIK